VVATPSKEERTKGVVPNKGDQKNYLSNKIFKIRKEMKTMKKKIITLCLVIAMLSVAVIGGTLAYFTDEEQARNEFTIGNVEIDLWEVVGQVDGADTPNTKLPVTTLGQGNDGDTVQEYAPIMPGDEMKKTITVENTGSEDAYIAISIKHELYRTFNSNIDTYYEGLMTDEKGNPVAEKIAAVNKTLGTSYTTVEETMQYITDAIWSGNGWNLWYDKHSADTEGGQTEPYGTRYYPTIARAGQDGTWNHAKDFEVDAEGNKIPTLVAVDYVVDQNTVAYPNSPERSGYAKNMLDTIDAYESLEDNNRMWVYYYYVPAGQEVTLDLSFSCPTWIDNSSINAFGQMILDIQAAAIQTSGFDTAEEAFQVVADQLGFATNG
jgi:predicted ribosomally synthesized peptide with SipW-like signal peptide